MSIRPRPQPDAPRCEYADDDAAYVLGALDPIEQQAFRAHLPGCSRCRAAVADLAVMPGMLARLLPETESELAAPAPLLPSLVKRVESERRNSRWRARLAGFLVAAVLGGGAALIVLPDRAADPDRVLTMAAEPGVPVRATLLVTGRGWGTSIDTTCRYDGDSEGGTGEGVTYELWAIDAAGQEVLVSSWQQLAGREITVAGSTRLGVEEISRLEVRTGSGQAILTSRL